MRYVAGGIVLLINMGSLCLAGIAPSTQVLDPGRPWPKFQKRLLPIPPKARNTVLTVLQKGDVNRDGRDDLVAVWYGDGRSIVAIYQAIPEDHWYVGHEPFDVPRLCTEIPGKVTSAAVCDVDRDGAPDLMLAVSGSSTLLWVTPTAENEATPRRLELPGPVTALAALDWGRRDLIPDPVIGVKTGSGAALVLFPTNEPAFGADGTVIPISGTVDQVVAANLDGDAWWDLAVTGERGLSIVHGFDTARSPSDPRLLKAEPTAIEGPVAAVAAGRFLRKATHDLTLLTPAGFQLMDRSSRKIRAAQSGLLRNTNGVPFFSIAWEAGGSGPALVFPRDGGLRMAGAAVVDGTAGWSAHSGAEIDLGGDPSRIVPIRRNLDRLDDLVIALEGDPRPVILLTLPRNTFSITTADDHDDGSCTAADCSLREAILAANALAGPDLINTTGSYVFTLSSELPDVLDTTTFDLNNQGYWYIDGTSITGGSNGLRILGDSCAVYGAISENHAIGGLGHGGTGIIFLNTSNSALFDGMVSYCGAHGIQLYNAIDCTVEASVFGNYGDGFLIYRGASGTTSGNTLDRIGASNNDGHGVNILGAPDTTIGGTTSTSSAYLAGNSGDGLRIEQLQATGTITAKLHVGDISLEAGNTNGIVLSEAGVATIGIIYPDTESYIEANHGSGIEIENSSSMHRIANCIIGFAKDGTAAGNDTDGIRIFQASNVLVTRNVISNNGWNGVDIYGNPSNLSSGNTIEDNIIGADWAQNTPSGNGWYGVNLEWGVGNSIGTAGRGNVIVANGSGGIRVYDYQTTGNTIRDNMIGQVDGGSGSEFGNFGHGIWVEDAPDNTIGPDNTIVFSRGTKGEGIVIKGNQAVGVNCSGNSIYDNEGLGIDLGADGVTLPDAGDVDAGPNGLLNQPILGWVEACGTTTYVSGRLDGAPSPLPYTISYYSSIDCDPSGMGEGRWPVATTISVVVPSSGSRHFRTELPGNGSGFKLTALTMDSFGSTSEFSNCRAISSHRPGDANSDCDIDADDIAHIIRAATVPGYVPPGDADADENGTVEPIDAVYDVLKIFW